MWGKRCLLFWFYFSVLASVSLTMAAVIGSDRVKESNGVRVLSDRELAHTFGSDCPGCILINPVPRGGANCNPSVLCECLECSQANSPSVPGDPCPDIGGKRYSGLNRLICKVPDQNNCKICDQGMVACWEEIVCTASTTMLDKKCQNKVCVDANGISCKACNCGEPVPLTQQLKENDECIDCD
jgi:hypothetical protein